MAQFVVRNLEEDVKRRLKRQAARHGCSLEEEVRQILRNAVAKEPRAAIGLGSRIAAIFENIGLDDDLLEWHGEAPRPATFDT
jgi:plasmid stability protein